ncbi:MAG: translocation/assembly module TamB domain-containing protein [Thermodesulfobacteriota bacterium]
MGRGTKTTKLILWLLLALFVALGLAAWGLGQSQAARGWLAARLQQEVAAATGARLELASLEGSLILDARLKGLKLVKDGRLLLAADELRLSYNPLLLLLGRARISSLTAVRPRVNLPWDLAGAGGGGAPPLTLSIAELRVEDGALTAGGGLGPVQRAEGVTLSGGLVLNQRGLDGRLQLSRVRVWLAGLAAPLELKGRTRLRDGRLELERVQAASGPNQVQVDGSLALAPQLALKLKLQAQDIKAEALPVAWPLPQPPRGPLGLTLSLSGPLQRLQVQGRVSQGGSGLKLAGWCNVLSGAMQMRAELEGLSLPAWGLADLPLTLEGRAQVDSQAWPGAQGGKLGLDLELSRVQYQQMRAGPLRAQARLEGARLVLESLSLESPWGGVSGQGRATLPLAGQAWRAEGSLELRQAGAPPLLAEALPALLKQARLSGQVYFVGGGQELQLKLKLGPAQLAPGLEMQSLEASGGWQKGRWQLSQLSLEGPLASLSGLGRADLEGGDLALHLHLPDLARLGQVLARLQLPTPEGLEGDLEMQARLRGPWRAPRLQGRLSSTRLLTAYAWMRRAEAEFDLKQLLPKPLGWVNLRTLPLISGELFLAQAQARLELGEQGQRLSLEAQGPEMSLGLGLTSRQLFQLPLRAELQGLWLQRPEMGRWSQQGLASLVLDQREVQVQGLALAQAEQRLLLAGRVDPVSGAVQAAVSLQGLRLAPLLRNQVTLPWRSELSVQGRLSGTLEQPRLDLSGRLSGLQWRGVPATEVEFAGSYGQDSLGLQGSALQAGRPVAQVQARLGYALSLRPPVAEPTQAGIKVQARARELALELLAPFLPGISSLKGRLRLNLEVAGSLAHPQVQGSLEVSQGALVVEASGQEVKGIELRLALKDGRLRVERCQALAGGKLEVTGHADLPRQGAEGSLELHLTAEGVKVSLGTAGQMTVQANLSLTGSTQRPVLTGLVRPSDLTIAVSLNPPAGLGDVVLLRSGQKPPPLAHAAERFSLPPFLDPLAVDLRAELADPSRVNLSDGWLDARGALRLTKEPGKPLTFNEGVVVDKGLLIFAGKRFEVLEGGLSFRGRSEPNPDLEGEAKLNLGATTVFVNVAGTAADPLINLSSLPPMSQTDILSTIIFGRPANKLTSGQSRELSAQALALLGSAGRQELEKLFGPSLAPDVVTVYNAPSTGSALEAGKYLSEQLYLRYRQNMGPYGGQNVGLEYRFSRDFAVESQMGSTRDSGVDLVFSKDLDFGGGEEKPPEKKPARKRLLEPR